MHDCRVPGVRHAEICKTFSYPLSRGAMARADYQARIRVGVNRFDCAEDWRAINQLAYELCVVVEKSSDGIQVMGANHCECFTRQSARREKK